MTGHYTRSINLERDADSEEIVKSYIPTSRTITTFNRICDALEKKKCLRSWALVGPYGSGKSAFAVFLSHLLGRPTQNSTISALTVLAKDNFDLAADFGAELKDSEGYLPVLITGAPEPLSKSFAKGIHGAVERFWHKKRIKKKPDDLVEDLNRATEKDHLSIAELMNLIKRVQEAVLNAGGQGILIILVSCHA